MLESLLQISINVPLTFSPIGSALFFLYMQAPDDQVYNFYNKMAVLCSTCILWLLRESLMRLIISYAKFEHFLKEAIIFMKIL